MTNSTPMMVDDYAKLPYTFIVRQDEDGDFVARIKELSGCVAHGHSESEAIANVRSMQRLWLEDCLEAGDPVPTPERDRDLPSGKWVQRVPRSLHKRLVEIAEDEQVSLNQLVATILSEGIARMFRPDVGRAEQCANCPVNRSEFWNATPSMQKRSRAGTSRKPVEQVA